MVATSKKSPSAPISSKDRFQFKDFAHITSQAPFLDHFPDEVAAVQYEKSGTDRVKVVKPMPAASVPVRCFASYHRRPA